MRCLFIRSLMFAGFHKVYSHWRVYFGHCNYVKRTLSFSFSFFIVHMSHMSSSHQKPVIPIIYWTKWFDMNQWEGYTIDKCNLLYTCKITHDRSKTTDTSVIIFHASDLTKDMPSLKKETVLGYIIMLNHRKTNMTLLIKCSTA
jgi:hypothetical protein